MELTQPLDPQALDVLGFALPLFGAALLSVDLLLQRIGRPERSRRARDLLLGGSAIVAALYWWNPVLPGLGSSPSSLYWVHFSDSFHYYMGPKYFRELDYIHLYECTALAELQLGSGGAVADRFYRDLSTNDFVDGRQLLRVASACRDRFSRERWEVFVHDVDFFRRRSPYWQITMQDWGYNATPAWNALGSLLAGDGPVTERRLGWLTLLDIPVLFATWGLVAWAFGGRTACVAILFWGTNFANGYGWTGGSILRQEWLLASVAGVCLLRRELWLAAGMAIAYAASLAIFPGFLAIGIGLRTVARWANERRLSLSPPERRLLLGAALTLALVLPAAVPGGGGFSAWRGFVVNLRNDMRPSMNKLGLPALLSYQAGMRLRILQLGERDPNGVWREARDAALARRAPFLALAVAAYLALAIGAVRRQPAWVAAILGLGLVVLGLQLNCYYYALMLIFGLLWPRYRSIGIALLGVAAASRWISWSAPDQDDLWALFSLVPVAFVLFTAAVVRFARDAGSARQALQEPTA